MKSIRLHAYICIHICRHIWRWYSRFLQIPTKHCLHGIETNEYEFVFILRFCLHCVVRDWMATIVSWTNTTHICLLLPAIKWICMFVNMFADWHFLNYSDGPLFKRPSVCLCLCVFDFGKKFISIHAGCWKTIFIMLLLSISFNPRRHFNG